MRFSNCSALFFLLSEVLNNTPRVQKKIWKKISKGYYRSNEDFKSPKNQFFTVYKETKFVPLVLMHIDRSAIWKDNFWKKKFLIRSWGEGSNDTFKILIFGFFFGFFTFKGHKSENF